MLNYCEDCGEKLEPRFTHVGYDRDTGARLYTRRNVCPNYRWWLFFLGIHDNLPVNNPIGGALYTESQYKRWIEEQG